MAQGKQMDDNTELKLQVVRGEGYEIMLFNENNYDILTERV